jgi:hypothetical protein
VGLIFPGEFPVITEVVYVPRIDDIKMDGIIYFQFVSAGSITFDGLHMEPYQSGYFL